MHGLDKNGKPKPLTKLAESKTWNRFANNVVAPMADIGSAMSFIGAGKQLLTRALVKKSTELLAGETTNTLVDNVAAQAKSWLGEDYKVITNKAGDNIFMSKDGLRKIRFDINNSQGDLPHVHLEIFKNGKWKEAIEGTHRIYPKP